MTMFMLICIFLLLVDLTHCGGLAQSETGPTTDTGPQPTNVGVSCLNLNYTLNWEPPKSDGPTDATLYTVFYYGYEMVSKTSFWAEVPSCINTTELSCYIFPVFNGARLIYLDLKVSVRAHDQDGKLGAPVNISFNPMTDAFVGAPSVKLNAISPEEASIRLTPPLSPFDNNQYVTDILTEPNIKYNISLWKIVDSQTSEKISEQLIASRNDITYLANLDPDTSYDLHVFTSYTNHIGTNRNSPVTIFSFQTSQKKPDKGPEIRIRSETPPNCAQPNLRNVTINWKAPPADSLNGKITNYTIIWREKGSPATARMTVTAYTEMSYTIENLSRWKVYEVRVSANNNGGATPSSWLAVISRTLDIGPSKPVDLHIESRNDTSILLTWQHPQDFPECIAGYTIIYQWDSETDGVKKRQVSVNNATFYLIKLLEPAIYKVHVSAEVISGYDNITLGLPATITYPQTGDNGGTLISWLPIFAVLVLIIIVSFGLWGVLWKRNRLKRILGLHNLFNLDADNKILQFALNYAGSGTPTKHVETELFDAIVTIQQYPSANTCLDNNCNCERFHPGHLTEKLAVDITGARAERNLQELPVITPDIGCSFFPIFPDFSRKSSKPKTDDHDDQVSLHKKETHQKLIANPSNHGNNAYAKVGLNTNSEAGISSSLSMNDLYLRSTSVESATESSQLLSDEIKESKDSDEDIDIYFQMAQLPNLRKIKYSRLNSYSDTDIPSGAASDAPSDAPKVKDNFDYKTHAEQLTLNDAARPKKYANRPIYDHFHDTTGIAPDTTTADDKHQIVLKNPFDRMDSYPYVKMAVGHDDVSISAVINDGRDSMNNKQIPGCASDFTNNNIGATCNNIFSGVSLNFSSLAPLNVQQPNGHVERGYVDHGSQPSTPIKDEIDPYILLSQM